MFVLGASSDGVEKARLAHACSQVVANRFRARLQGGRTDEGRTRHRHAEGPHRARWLVEVTTHRRWCDRRPVGGGSSRRLLPSGQPAPWAGEAATGGRSGGVTPRT